MLSAGPSPGPSRVTRARAARVGGGAPKGGLISFPRAAEVSAKCLSHLFKFYGAWLVADGPAPGRKWVLGLGASPSRGVVPPGRAQIRPWGARTPRGAQPETPLRFPWTFLEGI